jgi:hypothetical protein
MLRLDSSNSQANRTISSSQESPLTGTKTDDTFTA